VKEYLETQTRIFQDIKDNIVRYLRYEIKLFEFYQFFASGTIHGKPPSRPSHMSIYNVSSSTLCSEKTNSRKMFAIWYFYAYYRSSCTERSGNHIVREIFYEIVFINLVDLFTENIKTNIISGDIIENKKY
jgi:hypothetical protein